MFRLIAPLSKYVYICIMQNTRIASYDIFRGVLLLGMVIFHILVNFTNVQFNQKLFYWVPLGFILFLGIILHNFLKNKTLKKFKLSIKLLIIFIVGNIPNFLDKNISFLNFILGDSSLFSFEILMPIVLVILISPLLDKIKYGKFFLCISFITLIVLNYLNIDFYNINFFIYGVAGYFIASIFNLDNLLKNKLYVPVSIVFSVGGFLVTQYCQFFDFVIILQVLGMYFLTNYLLKNNSILFKLGKHSLFLYVAHIVLIKILSNYYSIYNFSELIVFSSLFFVVLYFLILLLERGFLCFKKS